MSNAYTIIQYAPLASAIGWQCCSRSAIMSLNELILYCLLGYFIHIRTHALTFFVPFSSSCGSLCDGAQPFHRRQRRRRVRRVCHCSVLLLPLLRCTDVFEQTDRHTIQCAHHILRSSRSCGFARNPESGLVGWRNVGTMFYIFRDRK